MNLFELLDVNTSAYRITSIDQNESTLNKLRSYDKTIIFEYDKIVNYLFLKS